MKPECNLPHLFHFHISLGLTDRVYRMLPTTFKKPSGKEKFISRKKKEPTVAWQGTHGSVLRMFSILSLHRAQQYTPLSE